MAKNDNLTDFLTDVADAIREKKGITEKINPQDFSTEIKGIATSQWTGHADIEGLKAIGWNDEDIAYYQRYGVNWNEEDDEYHKVSDDNKALYGVLTDDNIQEYKDRIVYLPKIDFSEKTSMSDKFTDCTVMVATPYLQLTSATSVGGLYRECRVLVCTRLSAPKVKDANRMFYQCSAIQVMPKLDFFSNFPNTQDGFSNTFYNCAHVTHFEIEEFPLYNNCGYIFSGCQNIVKLPRLEVSKVKTLTSAFNYCYALQYVEIQNLCLSVSFSNSILLSKESLLYMIENEAATSAITITLHSAAYARLSTDTDIIAALANHPLVSLASA